MKKSGLADSPFFPRVSAAGTAPVVPSPIFDQPVYPPQNIPVTRRTDDRLNEGTSEQTNEGTFERMNDRTVEPLNETTHERLNVRSSERPNERTVERPSRPISRQSYDVFDDQAEAIASLALRWRKTKRRHVTKGEVIRELLEEALKVHG